MEKAKGLYVQETDEETAKTVCSAWSLDIDATQYPGDFTEIKYVLVTYRIGSGSKYGDLCEVDSWTKGGRGTEEEPHFQKLRFFKIRGLREPAVEALLEADQAVGLAKKYSQDGNERPSRIDQLDSNLCIASLKTAKEALGRYYDVPLENVSITISG